MKDRDPVRVWVGAYEGGVAGAPMASGLLSESELVTLKSRINTYMEACAQRRLEEESRARDREILAERVCMECNGTGKVKNKVWVPERKVWARAEGTRPCPSCKEAS